MDRRTMIRRAAETAAALALASRWDIAAPAWAQYVASGRIYDPRRFGAKGDGSVLDTRAVQEAIDTCTQSGGGTVQLGPGTYLTGTIVMKSNVTLELLAGARILASPNIADFIEPAEGVAAAGGKPGAHVIFAINVQNIALLGPGIIDGNSPVYTAPNPRPPVNPENEFRDVASFGTKRLQYISPMIDLANSTNVRVENITLRNAVGWNLHPVGCNQVLVKNVKVRNPIDSSNTDGIDPCSCNDVLITDCDVVTGDDAIDVKTLNPYGRSQDSKNVTVINCRVTTDCNGLKIGAEGAGNLENINFKHCQVYSANGPINERVISGIAIEMGGPRNVNGVTFDDITMTNVRTPIFIRLQTTPGLLKKFNEQNVPLQGSLRNVRISNVRATGAILTSSISGLATLPVQDITLSNIQIDTVEPGKLAWAQATIPERETNYTEANMFGRLPSYGIYARHVQGLTIENVTVKSQIGDPRPMLACDDVQRLTVENVDGTTPDPSQAFLDLKNVRAVKIQGNRAPAGTNLYSKISGADSHDIRFQNNDFSKAKLPVMKTPEVSQEDIKMSR